MISYMTVNPSRKEFFVFLAGSRCGGIYGPLFHRLYVLLSDPIKNVIPVLPFHRVINGPSLLLFGQPQIDHGGVDAGVAHEVG